MMIQARPRPLPDRLETHLAQTSQLIEEAILEVLPNREPAEELYDLMRDYPQRGGKRFRPALVLLCCQWFGGSAELALPSAVALELFHNFALIHDDIEDSSLFRRGKPTLHALHGIPLALNAGDSLYGMVYEVLSQHRQQLGIEKSFELIDLFNQIFRTTFEGQAYDIAWVAHNHFPSRKEYFAMIQRKTGMYSGRGPCQVGAFLAGASEEMQQKIGDFGEALGIGFQIKDDLLNLQPQAGEKNLYGKERGGDVREGKRTLLTLHLLERMSREDANSLRQILLKPAEDTTEADVAWCIQQAEAHGAFEATALACLEYAEQARKILAELPDHPAKVLAAELVEFLTLKREG